MQQEGRDGQYGAQGEERQRLKPGHVLKKPKGKHKREKGVRAGGQARRSKNGNRQANAGRSPGGRCNDRNDQADDNDGDEGRDKYEVEGEGMGEVDGGEHDFVADDVSVA
jgi:hypothetical protein